MIRIHTLGGLFAEQDGQLLAGAAAQPRRLAILALLVRAEKRGITREKLIAYLWTDISEDRARRSLTQALYALRQDLGSEEAILGVHDLRLNPELVESDAAEFDAARRGGRLEVAAAAYGGPFLDGFYLRGCPEFERWAEQERSVLAREYGEALEGLARAATSAGDAAGAVRWWRQRAGLEPLNERVAVAFMESLVAMGDPAGALEHARIYALLAEEEFGLVPHPDVELLAERLRSQAEPVASEAAASQTGGFGGTESSKGEPEEPTSAPLSAEAAPPEELRPAASEAPAVVPPLANATGAVAETTREQSPRWLRDRAVAWAGAVALVLMGIVVVWKLWPRPGDGSITLGQASKVTFEPGLELDPALSPDARIVAYAAGSQSAMQIYLRLLGGGRIVPVTSAATGNARNPRWSPDGTEIAFQARGSIWIVPAFGGAPRLLVRGESPSMEAKWVVWSPDGTRIAYASQLALWVRDASGGEPRRLANAPFSDPHSPAWSPDGRWLAYVDGNPAFIVGSDAPYATISVGNLAPSSIWVVSSDGAESRRLTDDEFLNVSPIWTPDGRAILFVSNRGGSRDVYRLKLDGEARALGPPARLTTGLQAHTISLSPDGRLLTYSSFTPRSNVYSIRIPRGTAASSREAQPLTAGNQVIEGLSVSPDGRWLAYDSDRLGNQDIFKMPLPEGEPVQLTTHAGDDFQPSWSPDGREIAYHSFRGHRRQIRLITADGARDRPAHPVDGDQNSPHWSPDGQHLTYETWDSGEPHLFVLTRESQSTWAAPESLVDQAGLAARWSPDGRHIAFIYQRTLWLLDVRSRQTRVIFETSDSSAEAVPIQPLWSPDSRTLYFKAFDAAGQASIWSVPIEGGSPTLLVRFDDPATQSRRPEIATDGEFFYFTIGSLESDIWALELEGLDAGSR